MRFGTFQLLFLIHTTLHKNAGTLTGGEMGMQCLNGVLSLDGTLSTKRKELRTQFFIFACAGWSTTLFSLGMTSEAQLRNPIFFVGTLVILLGLSIAICAVLCKVPLTTTMVVGTLYMITCGILMWDLNGRAVSIEQWPTLVLIIDILLVMQVPKVYSLGLVCFVLMWLLLLSVEESFRFGLFDLPGLAPQEGKYGRLYYLEEKFACETPPCPIPFPSNRLFTAVAVFAIDFIVTRGFAREVLKEQTSMERTINAVQEIASLLAKYDVEKVAELLKAHEGDLPEGMTDALRGLEENLRKYRPYLPAALFEEDEDGVQQPAVAPPGLDSEIATIVFTDIRASTSIWENAPEGMRAGLQIHNAVMRDVMRMCDGYEVKTIGDAFMIAFAFTCDGVAFGLRVQERLFEADWPASLLEDAPICCRQGSLWGGLTVRIGVNTGPVTVEENTLTGRTDYFGHTVNVASRLESTCKPGAVALPSDLWTSVSESCSAVAGVPEAVHLKGVSGSTLVCCVWPVSLGGRRETPLCESSRVEFSSLRRRSAAQLGKSQTFSESTWSAASSMHELSQSLFAHSTFQVSGTVGVAQLAVGDVGHNTSFDRMSVRLTTLTISLEQSGGSMVTLLGNCVCVGWNVSRSAPAHMENAIRFVQRMSAKSALNGAGLASGPVQHGDVGARSQRFVTVMGDVVRRSWALCEEAVRGGVVCLYESLEGTTLPSALEDVLVRHKGYSYRVVESDNKERDNVF